jgi:hypothetical protein
MAAGAAHASSARFCDRTHELTAAEQDRLLRFAAVLREELAGSEESVALVSRSGLDLSRFNIRYSHAALAWRSEEGIWSARQLYYACDEGRPRIYDQGLAGFAMGTDDPALGYLSIVRLPPQAVLALKPRCWIRRAPCICWPRSTAPMPTPTACATRTAING